MWRCGAKEWVSSRAPEGTRHPQTSESKWDLHPSHLTKWKIKAWAHLPISPAKQIAARLLYLLLCIQISSRTLSKGRICLKEEAGALKHEGGEGVESCAGTHSHSSLLPWKEAAADVSHGLSWEAETLSWRWHLSSASWQAAATHRD